MRIKQSFLAVICTLGMILSGCETSNGITGAYNVTKCDYKYDSISDLNISGIDFSNGVSPLQVPKVLSVLSSGSSSSISLDFTLNLSVTNPEDGVAALNGFEYIINIDDIDFTKGDVNQPMTIAAGETQNLPLHITVDLAKLMKGHSKKAVQNIVKNFMGVGSEKSNVTLKIKPSFAMAGSLSFVSPFYIPIHFSFGGK